MQTLLLFLPELIGTFLGAALGLAAAMWWDRKKDLRARRELTLQTLESIYGELEYIGSGLSIYREDPPPPPEVVPTYPSGEQPIKVSFAFNLFPEAAFTSAVHSGSLGLLSPSLQVSLSSFYDCCSIGRMNRNNMMSSYTRGGDTVQTAQFMTNAQTYLIMSCQTLEQMLPALQTELAQECDSVCRLLGRSSWRKAYPEESATDQKPAASAAESPASRCTSAEPTVSESTTGPLPK